MTAEQPLSVAGGLGTFMRLLISVKVSIPFMFRLLGASGLLKPAPKEGLSFCQNFGFTQRPF